MAQRFDSYRAALARRPRATSAATHLMLSAVACAVLAAFVVGLLYPGDYVHMAGAMSLFWLVVGVDVVIGPLLTFVVFNVKKPRSELQRDMAIIALLQVLALAYGAHTLYAGRPVALVFEVDRFRLLSPALIAERELKDAPPAYRTLPRADVWILGSRRPTDAGKERLQAVEIALEGYDTGQRPTYWQDYEQSRADVLRSAKEAAKLARGNAAVQHALEALCQREGLAVADARYLPVIARNGSWVAILRPNGDVAGFLPFDGF